MIHKATYLTKADKKRLLWSTDFAANHHPSTSKSSVALAKSGGEYPRLSTSQPTENSEIHPPPSLPTKGHVLWYNDPYHLSSKITELLKTPNGRVEEALELVERHTGAGNVAVYGTLLMGLARRGEHALVQSTFKQMLRKGMKPNSSAYTIVLGSIAALASRSSNIRQDRTKKLQEAQAILASIEEVDGETEKAKIEEKSAQLIHQNAMLKVCKECWDGGGIEYALELYKSMYERDSITYALMLQILARKAGSKEFKIVQQILEDITFSSTKMDAFLLSSFLMNCSYYYTPETDEFGQNLLRRFLSVPRKGYPKTTKGEVKVKMTPPLFHSCIRFLSMNKSSALAFDFVLPFLNSHSTNLHLESIAYDHGVTHSLLGIFIRHKKLDMAWNLLIASSRIPDELKYEAAVRFVAVAIAEDGVASSEPVSESAKRLWLDRAKMYESLRPDRASTPMLQNLVSIALVDSATPAIESLVSLVTHYLADIKKAGSVLTALRVKVENAKGSPLKLSFSQRSNVQQSVRFFEQHLKLLLNKAKRITNKEEIISPGERDKRHRAIESTSRLAQKALEDWKVVSKTLR